MLGPALAAIRAHVAAGFSTYPLRWQNRAWEDARIDHIDRHDNPIGAGDAVIPFVEGEIIGGRNSIRAFSKPGNRVFIHPGLVRLYLFAPSHAGTDETETAADEFAALFERQQINISGTQMVRFGDFSVDDGAASEETGNYFVALCSTPFEFYYEN